MAKASRQSFGEALADIGGQNQNIVALDADLSKSTMSGIFAEKYPDRFFEMGIQEANMIGYAAGLALEGKIPFICSFACFLTGRFDTIRISVGYNRANVKMIGTHAGIGIGEDGHSQMGLEDIALMRSIPGVTVIQPADDIEAKQAVAFAAEHNGPVYIRLTRQKLDDVHDSSFQFQAGKADVVADGTDMTIFATGGTVGPAVQAKEKLQAQGINARIVNVASIKPIDEDLIKKCAEETKCLFTVEDHTIMGGMGSAVAEVVSEICPTPLKRWGILDEFGQSGKGPDLYKAYKIDADGIATAASEFYKNSK